MNNKNLLKNIITNTDSYKFSHWKQYPKNTTNVFSYVESRGSKIEDINYTVFFGLQYFIKEYFSKPITHDDIKFAKTLTKYHGVPFNEKGWKYIVDVHSGKLPIKIKAVKEGSKIPNHNVLMTIEVTDPEVFWLSSYLETALVRAIWYPTTVATISHHCKQVIKRFLNKTSDNAEVDILHALNDFGARGVSSQESAGLGGMAHMINFMGSDTVAGMLLAIEYYNADMNNLAHSIPAAEHSTMTAWERHGERDAYLNMIEQYGREGSLFAVVSDSYDIYNAVENMWCGDLLYKVKEKGATAVLRPDSGDAVEVPIEIVKTLIDKVGYTTNSKGYKVLPNHVRVIQGDGICTKDIKNILMKLEKEGISASNIVFGMGGGLLQKCNRDTFKFAMKCSAIEVDNNKWIDVYKDPVTDKGKISKKGKITLVQRLDEDGMYDIVTTKEDQKLSTDVEMLELVFENGELIREQNFEEIRKNSN